MNRKSLLAAAVCIVIPMIVGGLSGVITGNEPSGMWYQTLQKPSFQPPNWLFGPVWSTLYFLMGLSLYFIWSSPASRYRTAALGAFTVQLILNFFWSLIFFRWHQLGLAAIEIVLLWFAIIAMIVICLIVRPLAGYLQLPYLAWVTFATVLTITIYFLNHG